MADKKCNTWCNLPQMLEFGVGGRGAEDVHVYAICWNMCMFSACVQY